MMKRAVISCLAVWSLSGCALIEQFQNPNAAKNSVSVARANDYLCWIKPDGNEPALDHNCDLSYWLQYWVEVDGLSWPNRRSQIENLGDDLSSTLRKVLLSQSRGTPYQARLRAQGWADELIPNLTPEMRAMLMVLVYKPSQEMLEFESALTILSRINTNQSKELETQQQRLQEQQQQIDQLLKIEASMMEKREGINQ